MSFKHPYLYYQPEDLTWLIVKGRAVPQLTKTDPVPPWAGVVFSPVPGVSLVSQGKVDAGPDWSFFRYQTFRCYLKEKSMLVPLVQFFGETISYLEKTKN